LAESIAIKCFKTIKFFEMHTELFSNNPCLFRNKEERFANVFKSAGGHWQRLIDLPLRSHTGNLDIISVFDKTGFVLSKLCFARNAK